jgi:hypothetical protein
MRRNHPTNLAANMRLSIMPLLAALFSHPGFCWKKVNGRCVSHGGRQRDRVACAYGTGRVQSRYDDVCTGELGAVSVTSVRQPHSASEWLHPHGSAQVRDVNRRLFLLACIGKLLCRVA